MIKSIYKESQIIIKIRQEDRMIKIKKKGVKQGDFIPPKLFAALLEVIFRQMDWKGLGLNING